MPLELTDLGGGVHRLTHPLPWALDHVHCYLVSGEEGVTLIDAGLGTPGTVERWREALARLGNPAVARLVLTHYHPDHVGASGPLQALTGAHDVVQGRVDRDLAVRAWALQDGAGFRDHLVRHGMPPGLAEAASDDEAAIPVQLARPTTLVGEGDVLHLDGEPFRVLELPGHADGHIALLGERSGRLFAGDVVLDGITPNVGRWEDTAVDPLGRYLATLRRLAELAPAIAYAGHRRVVSDVPARAAEIEAHHRARLGEHHAALRAGATSAWEVAGRVFGPGLGFHERRFALVEAISHLERLEREGRAAQVADGRWRPC